MADTTLSSDILEAQFGPTELELVWQAGGQRVSCTKVAATGQRLELSSVVFDPIATKTYQDLHTLVGSGQSMGNVFRNAAVDFQRQPTMTVKSTLNAQLRRWFACSGEATIVEVSIYIGGDHMHYADIFEIYSPAVSWPHTGVVESTADIEAQLEALATFVSPI